MKGSGLTTSSRSHDENDTIGLGDHVDQKVVVSLTHAHGIEGDRLARSENTHDHILFPSHCGDCGHPQFNIKGRISPEFYLAILGLSALRDVQIGHDLYPGDHGPFIMVRNGLVDMAGPIYPEPDFCTQFTRIGFDMNI